MNKLKAVLLFSVWSLLTVGSIDLVAQVPAPPPDNGGTPIFRVTVVERTTNAVSYRHRSGWTKVDLRGTPLAPDATGHADVNSRPGYIEVKTEMHKLLPASQYGPEYFRRRRLALGRHDGLASFRTDRNGRTVFWS
jgi:hypothetical protein